MYPDSAYLIIIVQQKQWILILKPTIVLSYIPTYI
jgi:hypothetical protein